MSVPAEDKTNRPTHRQVNLQFENKSKDTLCDPGTYVESGFCDQPMPPTLAPGEKGSAVFKKTPDTACGAVGVVTYDLNTGDEVEGKMAVMFSNPYDFDLYSNWFAVGIFDKNRACDYSLYNEMYYEEGSGFVRGKAGVSLIYKGETVTIRATMSDSYTPEMDVQVFSN